MSFKQVTALALAISLSTGAMAELKEIQDETLGEFYGQAAPVVEMSGGVTFESIVYTPVDGSGAQIITPGAASTDGAVQTGQQMTFKGQMFGVPSAGGALDMLFAIFPLRVGAVDTDNDGIEDRGAAMFSFQPNMGMGTGYSPIDITVDDSTVNIQDQVFVTNQGILILNDSITGNILTMPDTGTQYSLTPVKYF